MGVFKRKSKEGDLWTRALGVPEPPSYEEKLERSGVMRSVEKLDGMESGKRNKLYLILLIAIAILALVVVIAAGMSTCSSTTSYIELAASERDSDERTADEADTTAEEGSNGSQEAAAVGKKTELAKASGFEEPAEDTGGSFVEDGGVYEKGYVGYSSDSPSVNVNDADTINALIGEDVASAFPDDFARYCELKGYEVQAGTLSVVTGTAYIQDNVEHFVAWVVNSQGETMYFKVLYSLEGKTFSYTSGE